MSVCQLAGSELVKLSLGQQLIKFDSCHTLLCLLLCIWRFSLQRNIYIGVLTKITAVQSNNSWIIKMHTIVFCASKRNQNIFKLSKVPRVPLWHLKFLLTWWVDGQARIKIVDIKTQPNIKRFKVYEHALHMMLS